MFTLDPCVFQTYVSKALPSLEDIYLDASKLQDPETRELNVPGLRECTEGSPSNTLMLINKYTHTHTHKHTHTNTHTHTHMGRQHESRVRTSTHN